MLFVGFFNKNKKKEEKRKSEDAVVINKNETVKVAVKKTKKENDQLNIFSIDSDIDSLIIDSNINVDIKSTNKDSYYKLVIDEDAIIEKFDVIEKDNSLKIDLKVTKKNKRIANSNSNVTISNNVNKSISNISINNSNNVCINSRNSVSYVTNGNWKLNVYLNKDELKNLSINSCSGDVNVDFTVQKAQINTVSGDIDCENVTQKAVLKSTSGDITVSCSGEYETMDIDINSVSGDVTISLDNVNQVKQRIKTVSGDIDFDYEPDGETNYNLKVNTVSGDINIKSS